MVRSLEGLGYVEIYEVYRGSKMKDKCYLMKVMLKRPILVWKPNQTKYGKICEIRKKFNAKFKKSYINDKRTLYHCGKLGNIQPNYPAMMTQKHSYSTFSQNEAMERSNQKSNLTNNLKKHV